MKTLAAVVVLVLAMVVSLYIYVNSDKFTVRRLVRELTERDDDTVALHLNSARTRTLARLTHQIDRRSGRRLRG